MRHTLIPILILALSCNQPVQKKNIPWVRDTVNIIDTTLKTDTPTQARVGKLDTEQYEYIEHNEYVEPNEYIESIENLNK